MQANWNLLYYSLFQGWFDNQRATFQHYAIVAAEIAAKVRFAARSAKFEAFTLTYVML